MLSVLFILTLVPLSAGASEFKEWKDIKGSVYASEITGEGVGLSLKADTTLILDKDLSLYAISGKDYSLTVKDSGGYTLTVDGDTDQAVTVSALTFQGGTYRIASGSYSINGNGTSDYAVEAKGNIIISDAEVELASLGYPLCSLEGSITIKNSTVTAEGYDAKYKPFSCIEAGSITVEDSTVKATGHAKYGIYASGKDGGKGVISISNSTLDVRGWEYGIYNEGTTYVTGGIVKVTGGGTTLDLSKYTTYNPTVFVADNREGNNAETWDGVTPLSFPYILITPLDGGVEKDSKNIISSVSVTVTEPEIGKEADFSAKSPDAAVESVKWYHKLTSETYAGSWAEMINAGKIFKSGTDYRVEITLATEDENDCFASKDSLEITLNGETVPKDDIISASDNRVTIRKEYSLPEDLTEPVKSEIKNPFEDVKETDSYYGAVIWSYYSDPQITKGMDETHFGPDLTVNRGQCVTFLWRAEGCPEPKTKDNPFKDVKKSDYYYDAVLWANENGITFGTTEDTFSPDDTLTTQHIITFLYRTQNPGLDGWDGEAAAWACKNYANGKPFGVDIKVDNNTPCPRWCVVRFLYAMSAKG